MMKKNTLLIIVITLALLLIISGCGKKECKVDSDCQKSKCFTVKCEKRLCVKTAVEDCCGNNRCEDGTKGTKDFGETKCNCAKDCGKCIGKVENYLENLCSNVTINGKTVEECASDVDETKVKQTILTQSSSVRGVANFDITASYDEPFNIDKSLFNVKVKLTNKFVEKVKITKFQLSTIINKQQVLLGEEDVNKVLWNIDDEIEDGIIVSYPLEGKEGELSGLTLKIFYEYEKEQTTRNEIELKFKRAKLIWANPDRTRNCPASCDDLNKGTRDYCSKATDYFCKHEPIAGKCGNYICDATENKCTCAIDCGKCSGTAGEYTMYLCSKNICSVKVINENNYESKTLLDTRDLKDFEFSVKYLFNKPFNIKKDNFDFEFQLENKKEGLTSIKITKIRLMDGSELLTEQTIEQSMGTIGSKINTKVSLAQYSMKDPEAEKSIQFEIFYEYVNTKGNTIRNSYTKTFKEKFILLNPTK